MKKKTLIDKLKATGKEEMLTIYGLVFTMLGLWLAYFYESYSFIILAIPLNTFCSYFIFGKERNWKGIMLYSATFLITTLLLWLVIPQKSFEEDGLLLLSMEILATLFTSIGIILGVVLRSKIQEIQKNKNKKKVTKKSDFGEREKERFKERDEVDEREKIKKNKSECNRRRVSGNNKVL